MSAAPLPEKGVVVFDLDDTLYPERDFVRSGFRVVAKVIEPEAPEDTYTRLMELFRSKHPDPFDAVLAERGLRLDKRLLVKTYREHQPTLTLATGVKRLLSNLRADGQKLGIITDGRSRTQRNKIRALGLDAWFEVIVISEEFGSAKPAQRNFQYFERYYPGRRFAYVGNDLAKDFIAPNRLGWTTFCLLDHGQNIRSQHFHDIPDDGWPHFFVERLA